MSDFYMIMRCEEWFKAVIFQGKRAIDAAITDFKRPWDSFAEMEKSRYDRYIQIAEEHFFIIALGKAIDFLKRCSESREEYKDILAKIDSEIGLESIRLLRNMREHDDEYIDGRGKSQQDFITAIIRDDGNDISDATGTGIDFSKKEYWLGNKVNIYQVVQLFELLLSDFCDLIQHHMRSVIMEEE